MPSNVLKSLAKKASKSMETAERYWDEAKASVSKQKNKPSNKWAAVTGITKKRLGLEGVDLAIAGMSLDLICEHSDVEEDDTGFNDAEKSLQAIAIAELAKVEMGGKSSIVYCENGNARIQRSFLLKMSRMTERHSWDQLRKLFPGAMDRYIQFLAEHEE